MTFIVGGLNPTSVPSSLTKSRQEVTLLYGHAIELLEEVDVEEHAAELTVGDATQPDVLLCGHDPADVGIFDFSKLSAGDEAGGAGLSGVHESAWSEEAADVVGPEWGSGHLVSSYLGAGGAIRSRLSRRTRRPSLSACRGAHPSPG